MTFVADSRTDRTACAADDPGDSWFDDHEIVALLGPAPDAVDLLLEADGMVATFAAERLHRVQMLRRQAFDRDAAAQGRISAEITLRSLRLEIAAALRITEYAAGEMISLADALHERYPVVYDALHEGRVIERHAGLVVDAVDAVPVEARDRVLPRALALAEALPTGALRRALRLLVDSEQQPTLAERHAAATAERRVVVQPASDGMAWFMTLMPEVEARAIFERATVIAKTLVSAPDDERTLDQARADVVGDLLVDGATDCHPPEARGIRATVAVTVPVLALFDDAESDEGIPVRERDGRRRGGCGCGGGGAGCWCASRGGGGCSDAAYGGRSSHEFPIVEGVGPIPIERARELCGGADEWMRVLTHPESGMVLSVGRDKYRPPPSLRRLARWRAERCMAPGCGVPASRCEIDHTVAWECGGETSLRNLAPLCKGHHTLKHNGGWDVTQTEGGALEWVSPVGRRYVVHPERSIPVFRADVGERPPPAGVA